MQWRNKLISKISDKTAVIGIVGLGYVGLPLAVAFSKKFNIIGYNKSKDKTELLKSGKSYIEDILYNAFDEKLRQYLKNNPIEILFVHGKQDLTVRVAEIKSLIDYADSPNVSLALIEACNHGFNWTGGAVEVAPALETALRITTDYFELK